MAKLEVQIGADSSDLQKKIKEAEFNLKELSKVKLEQIKLGLDTKEINSNIASVKKSLNDLKTVAKDSGQAFAGMAPKVANGGNALMQFSRIAQDAPYGIIGIGNNITATVEAFGHLKQSTGSTGSALKALAGSIMGSGGILLAVSLVTTGLTIMSQQGLTLGDLVDKLTGKFDDQKKALTELGIEAAKTAGSEISALKSLVSVAQDDTKSRKERLIAVKELQDMYPAYFGNLSQEKVLNGDLTGIVRELSGALKERARASALSGKAGEIAAKELGVQEKIRGVYQDIFKILGAKTSAKQLAIIKALNEDNVALVIEQGLGLGLTGSKLSLLTQEYVDLRGELKNVGLEMNHIQKLADRATSKSIKLLQETPKIKKTKTLVETPQITRVGSMQTKGLAETAGMVLQIAKNVQGAEGMIATSMGVIRQTFDTSGLYMLEQLKSFNDQAGEIIQGGIADTFAGLGAAIGNALATGGNVMQAAGKALLGSVGALLTNLGTMAIQVGVGLIGIKAALKTLNPAVAIGAGVALIALGAVFSSKASALGGSGGSGGSGSVSTGASVSSPTSSTGGGGGSSFQSGTVVFEISGQSLIGVLGNTLDKNRRLGGSLSLG